jgi:hypothetical protein
VDPNQFEEICMQAGAGKLFSTLHMAMSSNRMSDEHQDLTKLRVMVVIYMIYSVIYNRLTGSRYHLQEPSSNLE